MSVQVLTRRAALSGAGIALAGAVAGYLVARNSTAARAGGGGGVTVANAYGPAAAASGAASSGRMLVALDQVPVGGGVVLAKDGIVVTRTAPDDVHAFSAVCTHQGCTVDTVADGAIDCPCHGSSFDAATGAVRRGPATRPLPPITVAVRSGQVFTS